VIAGGQDEGGLDEQVDRERGERVPDQAQAAALPFLPCVRQFPDHDGGGADLDERVQAEPGYRDRPGGDRGDGQDDDAGNVPAERQVLQDEAAANQDEAARVVGGEHGAILPCQRVLPTAHNPLFVPGHSPRSW
jgi:hypothetical protein